MSLLDKIKSDIVESHVWKAIFRHGYEDTPRNRVMMVTANVFLHLHPAKVRRHAVRMRFTWCMGGLTFLMFLVFLTGSYKPPREFNWIVGVLLLVLTLLLSFTGYLLPWDQLSIWAVTVGSNMARATPLLGYEGPFADFVGANPIYDARAFLFGGGEIGPHTLLRIYILHCIFIPLVASTLMAVHFWRIRRDGFSGPSL